MDQLWLCFEVKSFNIYSHLLNDFSFKFARSSPSPSKMNKIIVNYYWASFITFFVEYVRDSANIVYLISCLMSLTEEKKNELYIALKTEF